MASDIWLRTILIVRKETRCRHIGFSYRLTARVLLYAPSHRQDNTYHGLCYTSRGALAGTRNSSMGPPHEGLIRRPIAPWANALPLSYVPLPCIVRGEKIGCRGLCPVSVDEGILEVEDNWVSVDPMFQYTSLAWNSPRQVVVLARYYQSAG